MFNGSLRSRKEREWGKSNKGELNDKNLQNLMSNIKP